MGKILCDRFSQNQVKGRKKIVEVWHKWTQESFCDVVGFQIGGSAFVYAFSGYLQMLGRSHFHIPLQFCCQKATNMLLALL